MSTLEIKVKKITNYLLFTAIMVTCLLFYFSTRYIEENKNHFNFVMAENKISDIEKSFNSKMTVIVEDIESLFSHANHHRYYKNGTFTMDNDTKSHFTDEIKRSNNIMTLSIADVDGFIIHRFEKNVFNNDVRLDIFKTTDKSCNCMTDHITKHKSPYFSSIVMMEGYSRSTTFVPGFAIYYPIILNNTIIGVGIVEMDATQLLSVITNSTLFNIILYNSKASILIDNANQIYTDKSSDTLLNKFFDYRKMLEPTIYDNGTSVSKLLNLNFNVVDNFGVSLILNNTIIETLNNNIVQMQRLYVVMISVLLIFLGIVSRLYLYNSVQFSELEKYSKFLEIKNKELNDGKTIDELTKIGNIKAYNEKVDVLFDSYVRYGYEFSVVVFNIDNLEKINSSFGVFSGNEIIKYVVEQIKTLIRKSDSFMRYNETTFIILLPNTNQKFSIRFTKKIIDLVRNLDYMVDDKNIPITISAGVTTIDADDATHDHILKRAIVYMKRAKLSGKDRVITDET